MCCGSSETISNIWNIYIYVQEINFNKDAIGENIWCELEWSKSCIFWSKMKRNVQQIVFLFLAIDKFVSRIFIYHWIIIWTDFSCIFFVICWRWIKINLNWASSIMFLFLFSDNFVASNCIICIIHFCSWTNSKTKIF